MTGGVTYNSSVEIARVLEDLARERVAIYADLGESEEAQVFASTILWVEPDVSHFIVAYAADDAINSRLYLQPVIKFNANYQGERVSFFAHTPLDAVFEGKPAIHFPLPPSLLVYHRNHERIEVPSEAGLRCIVSNGKDSQLEMKVVDISEGGIGCTIYSEAEPFARGAVLKYCKIILPGGATARVVLSVQYSIPTMLPNGTFAHRAGMRFIEPPVNIRLLLKKLAA